MKTLEEIQALAKAHADARGVLAERVTALHDETETIKRRRLPGIKLAVGAARETRALLYQAIDESRPLFVERKTIECHGVRVGIAKGKGRVEWIDEKAVVAAIEKKLKSQKDTLIKVTKKPIKKALQRLSVEQLKKIGCSVVAAGEQVVITFPDDAIDKLVAALIEENPAEAEE